MARDSIMAIFVIVVLSTLLILSTKLPMYQDVIGKNGDTDLKLAESDSCHSQVPQIISLCRLESSEIQHYNAETRGHYADEGSPLTNIGSIIKHHNEYQEEQLGLSDFDQNNNLTNSGDSNYNESVSPALVGHGGSSGTGGGGSHGGSSGTGGGGSHGGSSGTGGGGSHGGSSGTGGGGSHGGSSGTGGGGSHGGSSGTGGESGNNGNNGQNDNHSSERKNSPCVPVTLSGLPSQTRPIAICLIPGKAADVATEFGYASFTLDQLNGGTFKLTIDRLNGQTQPAIVTVQLGMSTSIIVPGLGTGNVLIGNAYSVILDIPRV